MKYPCTHHPLKAHYIRHNKNKGFSAIIARIPGQSTFRVLFLFCEKLYHMEQISGGTLPGIISATKQTLVIDAAMNEEKIRELKLPPDAFSDKILSL